MKKDNGKNKPKKKETLYNKVYNDLIAKIQSGKLKVGDKLPTELELTEIYGVSRITVAHALKNLSDANLIYRVKRSGTFVNGKLNRNAPLIVPVVLPFVEDLNEIMMGIQNTALTFNTFTPFYNSKNNLERERKILTEVLSLKPDGIIVYPCNSMKNIDLYAELLAQNIPSVCIDRPIDGLETPLVTTKNADCMCRIIDRLAALGHKRIGFCSISDKMSFPEAERFKGFCRGIVKNKLSLKNEFIFHTYDLHKKEIAATLEGTAYVTRQAVHTVPAIRKAKKAIRKAFENSMNGKGSNLVEIVSTCNSGWKMTPQASNDWMVEHMFPFYPLGDLKDKE